MKSEADGWRSYYISEGQGVLSGLYLRLTVMVIIRHGFHIMHGFHEVTERKESRLC